MNTIPQDQWNERLENLMKAGLKSDTVKEAFDLYNDRLLPRETKTFCGGCTQRVWKRLEKHYESCKTNTNQ